MIDIKKILTIFIILMLIVPAFAADTKDKGSTVTDDKVTGQDKNVTDETKEKETKIINKDKSITGDIKVTTKDVSKFSVKKKSEYEISISKSGEHAKAKVSFPKFELQQIDIDKDGKFGLLHISDTGEVTHTTATEAELIAGKEMVFSENIVNGYSGYKQYTFSDVESGDTLNIDDVSGNYTITAAVDGVVPTYTAIDEHNISTYPDTGNLISVMLMDNSTDIVDSVAYTSTNVSYVDGIAQYNGIDSKITLSNEKYDVTYPLLNVRFSDIPSIDNREIFGKMVYPLKVGYRIVRESGELRFYVGNSKLITFSKIPISTLHEGDMISCAYNGTKTFVYLNGVLYDSDSFHGPIVHSTNSAVIGSTYYSSYQKMGVTDFVMYNSSLISTTHLKSLYAGGSGISFKPEPSYNFTGYNVASGVEKVLNTDSTCTGIEYVDTTGGTHDVTVTVYFTEDTTLISEKHNSHYQNVSIVHTAGHNATNGTLTYELLSSYNSTPVLTASNNTNASVARNSTHLLIYTGLLKTGQSKYYNISIPKGDGGFVNPSATVVVIITAAGAFIGGSFINAWYRRRRNNN